MAALATIAALAVLAGCGDSGPSKQEFVKKADALCAQTNKAHPPKPAPKNAKDAAKQQGEEIAIRQDLDKKLKELDVPDEAKDDFDSYNDGTQKIIAAITSMKSDAESNKEGKFAADSQAFEKAAADREKIAMKLGFKTCGRKNPVQ
ncbi:MAG TPA: hypothetical protein VJT75_09310 [Thermoleophilaceae bacterium]|nr:hypothetical protein [Thermoleophilaceae bacterium]